MLFRSLRQASRPVPRLMGSVHTRNALKMPLVPHQRSFRLSATQIGAIKGWGTIINIVAGAYLGGVVVSLGSLYLIYHDAEERQHLPFELGFANHIVAVKAINKDDVLKSPRYAVKHYRRLLINLAKKEDPNLEFDENAEKRYDVPLIDADTLVRTKSADFANFYIDIVLRYAKALLAKGELNTSITLLQRIIDNDDLFYRLGDAERLSQCCRLLSSVCATPEDRILYLQRSLHMLLTTFSSIKLDANYVLQDGSRATDELVACLGALAGELAKAYKQQKDPQLLTQSLNIYLSNLKLLSTIQSQLASNERNQSWYPLFNCDEENLTMSIAGLKAHISEVMWAKGYKKNAILWGEEVIADIYYTHSASARASPILINVLQNLSLMYEDLHDAVGRKRCQKLREELTVFDSVDSSWYDRLINRFCKIIYHKGPLGILEKGLSERFGQPQRILEIEEFEDEDRE